MIRLKALLLFITLFTVAGFASAAVTVNVSSPTSGATAASPIRVTASASSPHKVTGWWIYLDNQGVYNTGATSSINTSIAIPSGTHTLLVRAWDSTGAYGSKSLTVNVSGSTPVTPPASGPVAVTISPTSTTVPGGQTKQFSATVSGTTNTGVLWAVNGVQGGNLTYGTISSGGLYTAPACPSTTGVTVLAQSQYDGNAKATSAVTLTATTSTAHKYVAVNGNDSSDGSACRPWATIQKALNSAAAGMTIHVGPGTYTQNALTFSKSGTSTARIRLVSDEQWGAKIRSSASYTVLKMTGSYIDVVGFDVSGDAGSCLGIAIWGSYSQVIGNHVHHIKAPTTVCGSNGGAAIHNASYTSKYNDTIGNLVHDVGSWPTLDARVHGIYYTNFGGRIQNNVVFRCAGFGIHLGHVPTDITISNNTVFNNVYGGLYLGALEGTGVATSNMLVTNNFFINNVYYGIIETHVIGPNNRYINNVVRGNNQNGKGGNMILQTSKGSTQTGTITTDNGSPTFANYTGDVYGDYHLLLGSQALDAGTSTAAPTKDMNGGARPMNGKWDIGAYEYGSSSTNWPWM